MRCVTVGVAGIGLLVLSACASAEPASTTTATTMITTTTAPETTTTEAGPQPLPAGGFLEPGEYVTTLFEPTVMYRIEQKHILKPFQSPFMAGLQNRRTLASAGVGVGPYRGVTVHNVWRSLTADEVVAELEEIDQLELGSETETEVGGFPGRAIAAAMSGRSVLWDRRGDSLFEYWWLEPNQVMRFIILDTPAGTLLVTIAADVEGWDDFLPVAEEIVAGISFPDLES